MDRSDLDIRLRGLSPAKRALLEQRLKQSGAPVRPAQSIPRREGRDSAPLSFAQQRMWFLSQLEPESSSYNEANAIRLLGPLNVEALQTALNQLVARHEVLRTTIATVDSEPRQVVNKNSTVALPVIDLRETASSQRDAEIQNTLQKAIQRPFNLSRDLPLRVLLMRLGDQEHILLKVIHHIASDGWSSGIIWRELGKYYRDALSGTRSIIPELPIQYQDYAEWQRQWLRGEVLDAQVSYWKKQLGGVAPLRLPFDRPRPPGQRYRGARQSLVLPRALSDRLKAFSAEHGVTLFMTLLAGFQSLLHRYTGQDDIAVGSPIAGRTRPEIEGLIGFFVNTLVFRTQLHGNPTFKEILERVREHCLEAYEHQDIPFEKLVEELNPVRDLNTTPLFQVLFAYQNVPRVPIDFAGIETAPVEVSNGEAKFDLFLAVLDQDRGLRLRIEYATDLFDATSIERMLRNLQTLLDGVMNNPNQRLSELPLLDHAERHQLVVAWNDTQRDYPKDKCVHQLFQDRTVRISDCAAVVFEDHELTYKELNCRANQLARHLGQLGVTRRTHVAICMDRGIGMTVAVLGALKAGAAYVPLDPEYPVERLLFMLQDTGAPVLLTQREMLTRVFQSKETTQTGQARASLLHPSVQVVVVDAHDETVFQQSGDDLPGLGSSDDPAYVIYTSGSTGKPKGVVMEHRSLGNLIMWQVARSSCSTQARTLQFASLSFDVSFQEMFSTWCSGGTLVLLSGEIRRDPVALLRYLTAKRVERVFLPFIALQQLADVAQSEKTVPAQLREVITAGEQLQITPQIRRLFERMSDCCLVNQYGPSESHVVTAFTLGQSRKEWPALPPIGRPIQNAMIYILDSNRQPVPIGVAGELYIGGDGVARGYLNRPELTAEKFITHSFDGEPARRLYKTGDLARYLFDGNIEFLGRIDNQVKIRGYRIELGEIEFVLCQHPGVGEAVVVAREDVPGDKRLVAYLVAASQNSSVSEISGFLKAKLPEYMIPSIFMFLDALPLTPSGKLDRKSLPAPDRNRDGLEQTYVAPRDNVEYRLAKIWEDILGVRPIGVTDNFFESGGHSLLAVRLLARVEKEFNRSFPLAALFTGPTIDKLADLVRPGAEALKWNWLFPIQSTGSKPPLFMLHGSGQLGRQLDMDQPVYGGRTHGLDGRRAHPSVEKMAAEYVKEICMVQPEGPYFVGGFCFGGLLAFEVARQLREQDQEVALLLLLDPTIPGKGGAWSAVSLRLRQAAITRLAEKVRRHSRKLRPLSVQERLTRVGRGVQWRFNNVKARLARRVDSGIKMLACRVFLAFGQLVPEALRMFYFKEVCLRAARNYVPKVYSGRVVLLRPENATKKRLVEWKRLLAGKLEIYELPSERHMDPIEGPRTPAWAERVRACLKNAQSNVSDDSSPGSNS